MKQDTYEAVQRLAINRRADERGEVTTLEEYAERVTKPQESTLAEQRHKAICKAMETIKPLNKITTFVALSVVFEAGVEAGQEYERGMK